MFRSRWFRLAALFAVLLSVFSMAAIDMAEARSGGSFGSRGMRTYQTIPSTPTVPHITGPVQRSMNTPSATNPNGYGSNFGRPGLFGGMGGWLLGGLLFSGLFGMMFGGGFGGFGGIFSLLIQLGIAFFVVRWLIGRFGRTAGPGPGYGGNSYNYAGPGAGPQAGPGLGGFGGSGGRQTSEASHRAGNRDEIGIGDADLQVFEQRLKQLQDAYSREDYDALRRISTPEVMSHLTEELAQAAAKGLRNEVFDVNLLSGDVAEAWREGSDDYATVAMRYESRDVMRERATGKLVSGEDRVVERSEVWTFVRHGRGDWLLSAIQGA